MASKKSSRRLTGLMEQEYHITIRQARMNMVDTVKDKVVKVDESNDDDANAELIMSKFNSVECAYYKEDPKNSTDRDKRCYCGESKTQHEQDDDDFNPGEEWNQNKCMRTSKTETFGRIKFIGEDVVHNKLTEFVRLSHKDKMEDVMDLLFNYWKINIGSLCISVIGGAKNFKMGPRDKAIFSQGLVKAAQTTNALIITSGLNLGITRVVGDAIQKGHTLHFDKKKHSNSLCCLGISPWGYVLSRKQLMNAKGKEIQYKVSNEIKAKQPVSLNNNHTHYLFIDEGRRNGFANTEAGNFRASFEKDLAQEKDYRKAIPVVLVVVEGGHDVFNEASRSVKENVPLVICEGTGRASDILGEAYRVMLNVSDSDDGFRHLPDAFVINLKKKLLEQKISDKDKVEEAIVYIETIVQNESLITFFDMKNTESLDHAILYSLIKKMKDPKATLKTSICNQIQLCLTWNRVDIAKEKIFNDDVELSKEEWTRILDETLRDGKHFFLDLFLLNGAKIPEYLNVKTLNNLYKNCPKNVNFKHTVQIYLKRKFENGLEDVKDLLARMIGQFSAQNYTDKKILSPQKSVTSSETNDDNDQKYRRPFQDLFLWALLMEKYECAKLFWERSEDSIFLCLVATKILQMIERAASFQETERMEMLLKWKDYYETMAIKVLEECYEIDRDSATYLLERKNPLWGNLTCLELAHRANDQRFISSMVCQSSIDFTWRSGLKVGFPRCFFAIFFPCLIPKLQSYEKESSPGASQDVDLDKVSIPDKKKLSSFYTAPQTKFWIHLTFHILLLIYLSAVVLYLMKRKEITVHEYIFMAYLASLIMDKIIQMSLYKSISVRNQIIDWWFYSGWNQTDVMLIILALIAMLLRVDLKNHAASNYVMIYRVSKTIYSIIVGYLYLKLLRYIIIHPNLGPKMVMISKMIRELLLYLVIIVIILLAYGVTSQASYYPERKFYAQNLSNIVDSPYWTLFGELSLEKTVYLVWCDDAVTNYDGPNDCAELNLVVPIIYSVYILVGNILLLNVLIAIFSHIFQDIHQNSIVVWKFNMYSLVCEYKAMPILPIPFSLIFYFVNLFRYVSRQRCCQAITNKNRIENFKEKQQKTNKRSSSEDHDMDEDTDILDKDVLLNKWQMDELKTFESDCQLSVLNEMKLERQKTVVWGIDQMGDRLKSLSTQVAVISDAVQKSPNFGSINKLEDKRVVVQRESSVMEDKVFDMSNSMNMILDELRHLKQGGKEGTLDDLIRKTDDTGRRVKKISVKLTSLTSDTRDTMQTIQTIIKERPKREDSQSREVDLHKILAEIDRRDARSKEQMDDLAGKVREFKETMENSMKTLESILQSGSVTH